MGLIDKQMYLRDLQEKLGHILNTDEVNRIIAAADEALIDYEVTSAPTGGGGQTDSDDLLRYFLDAKRVEGRSEKTVERYRYLLTRLTQETGVPLQKMTVYHIRSYCTKERERGISPNTLEGYRQVYSSFYGWISREGLIEKNPLANLTAIKQPQVVRKPFSPVELAKIEEAAASLRDRAMIAFLASTGCRVSEVCSVNRADVHFNTQRLTVTGKGNKQRMVYLDDVTIMLIARYLEQRTDDSPALFAGRGTGRMTPCGVRSMLKRIEAASGVENVHPHRFRRTRATTLIDKGMPIQEVAKILGHDNLDTTMCYVYIDERSVGEHFRRYA